MLEKNYRIERNKVNHILKKGEDSVSKLFIIRYIKNDKKFNRYCTITSKRIHAKAVDRNRLRRQIYEAVRLATKGQPQPKEPHDIVLIPKKNILSANFEEILEDIGEIIKNHG